VLAGVLDIAAAIRQGCQVFRWQTMIFLAIKAEEL
jgi:hypothetical protein